VIVNRIALINILSCISTVDLWIYVDMNFFLYFGTKFITEVCLFILVIPRHLRQFINFLLSTILNFV